ncbi:MAG: hypothetical protein Q4E28_00145 [Clostridia bacterium]|nr:hypothetical protein [Clostridia bacterium]
MNDWFTLDNAAKVFPGQNTSTWSNVFRMTAVLYETIDPSRLSIAANNVIKRFPCFDVEIHKGLFWYYFEKNQYNHLPVNPDRNNPCLRIKFHENNRYLLRVFYHNNRISVEIFHALTDAFGLSRFLCTLVAEYLRLDGHKIPAGHAVLSLDEEATEDEMIDATAHFDKKSKGKIKNKNSGFYHVNGEKYPSHNVRVTTGFINMDDLKKVAKSYPVTITEYLASVLTYVVYQHQKHTTNTQKIIGCQIPVNLRNFFNTKTLRNFSLCYQLNLDPKFGEYTFEEILQQLALNLRYINNEKTLNAMISSNIRKENASRFIPLVIKDLFMGIFFGITAEHNTSILLSNLGLLKIPKEMEPLVQKFIMIAPHGIKNAVRTAAIGYNGTLALSFTNIFKEDYVEREFFRFLVKKNIRVKVESNMDY